MTAHLLAIADILEDALMHREICTHAGKAAYKRVRDLQQIVLQGSMSPDEGRHHALADLRRALETPLYPDVLAKRDLIRKPDAEVNHA